ncbi:MAG: hypothetical protein ACM3ST_00995 [Bdellovibrio bacteriovorus]
MLCLSAATFGMPLSGRADDDGVGILERRPDGKAGTWVIGRRSVQVTERAELDADQDPLVLGACLSVGFDGGYVAVIESELPSKCHN